MDCGLSSCPWNKPGSDMTICGMTKTLEINPMQIAIVDPSLPEICKLIRTME